MKKAAILFLKVAIPLALFAYLLWRVEPEHYRIFWEQPKRWDLMSLALASAFSAIILSFLRWRILVRAFEIPFTVIEALRLGFFGYLLNFVSFGSLGGDLFKAILVAKDRPQRRPEAIASVLLDRAIGLLGLVLLASISLLAFSGSGLPTVLIVIRDWATAVAIVAIVALLTAIYAGAWFDRLIDWGSRIPLIGHSLARMARALRLLRHQHLTLLGVIAASVSVHALLALSIYLISCGAYTDCPTLQEHLMVVPPALAAGAMPLAPGGLGYQEAAIAKLFETLPNVPEGYSGMLVATIYRLVTVVIAGIGLPFYWSKRTQETQNLAAQAEFTR